MEIKKEETDLPEIKTEKVPMPSGRTPGWLYDNTSRYDIGLLFRSYSGATFGQNKWWKTYDSGFDSEHSIFSVASADYELILGDDFNGDEITDLVWSLQGTVYNFVCYGKYNSMNNWERDQCIFLPGHPDPDWQIQGSGDFNRDGETDLVVRNTATGDNAVWLMDGAVLSATVLLPAELNTAWNISAVADIDSDGYPDILWDRETEIHVWQMKGDVIAASQFVIGKAVDVYVGAVGDMNADGYVDIILRDSFGGNKVVEMNGKPCPNWFITNSYPFDPEPDTDWVMEGP